MRKPKLPLTPDEREELARWLEDDRFKILANKMLPYYEGQLKEALATTAPVERELLISRLRLEGAQSMRAFIINLKAALRSEGEG